MALSLAGASPRPQAAREPPRLEIHAPPDAGASVARLRAIDLTGLDEIVGLVGLTEAGPPIDVHLVPSGAPLATSVPDWIAGFAVANESAVVIFPARAPVYPHDSLESVLRHEVAHVLIGRAARLRPVPRWFDEGLAAVAERTWRFEDGTRLAWEALTRDRPSPREVDAMFTGDRGRSTRAYALAAAVVRDLLDRQGPDAGARVLAGVAGGVPFDLAFARVAGAPPEAAWRAFWATQTFWIRWVPLLTGSAAIWMGITLLALVAFWRRRAKSAAIRQGWEAEVVADEEEGPVGGRSVP